MSPVAPCCHAKVRSAGNHDAYTTDPRRTTCESSGPYTADGGGGGGLAGGDAVGGSGGKGGGEGVKAEGGTPESVADVLAPASSRQAEVSPRAPNATSETDPERAAVTVVVVLEKALRRHATAETD